LIQRLVMSDPSPAYVYRVASVFRDNGAGVRGDLQAGRQSDPARLRSAQHDEPELPRATATNGEPVIRTANILRAFNAFSNTQHLDDE